MLAYASLLLFIPITISSVNGNKQLTPRKVEIQDAFPTPQRKKTAVITQDLKEKQDSGSRKCRFRKQEWFAGSHGPLTSVPFRTRWGLSECNHIASCFTHGFWSSWCKNYKRRRRKDGERKIITHSFQIFNNLLFFFTDNIVMWYSWDY